MQDFMVFTTLIPRLTGSKVTLFMLEYMPELFQASYGKGAKHPVVKLLRFIEYVSSHYAHRVIAVCETQLRRVVKSNGLDRNKIPVVVNVPDDAIFAQKCVVVSNNGNHFRLITHGALLHRQGVQTLIKAVPLLSEDIPELTVDIVGDGEYRSQLEGLTQRLGVGEYVNTRGHVPIDSIPSYIAPADVAIVPHLLDLMLPIEAFEYLAMGRPILAADHTHMREYLGPDTMPYFRPGDEEDLARRVLELYHSRETRKMYADRAAALYQKRRWSITKLEYLKVYETLI